MRSNTLQPTFTGHVASTNDALILFEACLIGHLNHVPRRPHDRERNSLICSGRVFIYVKNASGIKRWTDGLTWSPSRVLGDFLVYRELNKPLLPGEKKEVTKKQQRRAARPGEPYPRLGGTGESYSHTTSQSASFSNTPAPADAERQLVGSLTDTYDFKHNGLVKKTMSVTVHGVAYHLISYYNMNDVKMDLLQCPSQAPTLSAIVPRIELTSKLRAPSNSYHPYAAHPYAAHPYAAHPYAAYPQHGQQQGASVEYAGGPLMRVIPQMAAPQITFREGQYNQQIYRDYEPFISSTPPQSHLNCIPTPSSVLPPEYSTSLQHHCSKSN
jgi:hypothetical protein